MRRRFRRRQILLDKLQYRLLTLTLVHSVIILAIMAAVVFLPPMIQLENRTLPMVEKEKAANEFLTLHARVWPAFFIVLVALGIHSVVVSHRIAGPLYRFRRIFEALGAGDLSVVAAIRRRDYLWKEAEAINQMITSLGGRVEGVQQRWGELQAAWGHLRGSLDKDSSEEIARHVDSLEAHMKQVKASLGQFKLTPPTAPGKEKEEGRISGPTAADSVVSAGSLRS